MPIKNYIKPQHALPFILLTLFCSSVSANYFLKVTITNNGDTRTAVSGNNETARPAVVCPGKQLPSPKQVADLSKTSTVLCGPKGIPLQPANGINGLIHIGSAQLYYSLELDNYGNGNAYIWRGIDASSPEGFHFDIKEPPKGTKYDIAGQSGEIPVTINFYPENRHTGKNKASSN